MGPALSGCREIHMAFRQISAPAGPRPERSLSADNPPPRHAVMDILRRASLGLNAGVLATLDSLLGCLPPRRNHHTVFASNATLAFRRNGITDRTLRRHIAALAEAGLLARHDSPNGKRYTRRGPDGGTVLRFGLDLTPLFARLPDLQAQAQNADLEAERIAYLRAKLRAAAAERLRHDPADDHAADALRALRRKLSVSQCEALLAALPPVRAEAPVSAHDGQNVRHQQNPTTERKTPGRAGDLTVRDLVEACPEAISYASEPIATVTQAITHARTLARLQGIDAQEAEKTLGPVGAALALWAITQLGNTIRNARAYFRAMIRRPDFDPIRLVRQLHRRNCPRTTPVRP